MVTSLNADTALLPEAIEFTILILTDLLSNPYKKHSPDNLLGLCFLQLDFKCG